VENMSFWQVADVSPQKWPTQRCLLEPSSAAVTELIQQICSVDITKAQKVFETVCHPSNWANFRGVSASELKGAGLTQSQSAKLLAALELGKRAFTLQPLTDNISDPENANAVLQYDLGFSPVEKSAILILDIKHHLIAKEIIAIGNSSECIVDPKVVFERILRNQGSRFVLAHNHPSGSLDASPEDIEMTRNFLKASKLMNIQMLDHLVIVQGGYCSIRQYHPDLWSGHDN
jgi:DNA repair protein RadC